MTETEVAENPLLEGLGPRRTPEPCVLVIFGASGDLTRRKIFPALYALAFKAPRRAGAHTADERAANTSSALVTAS